MVWRNEKCPCWSGKNYKGCWWAPTKSQNSCRLYLQENAQLRIAQIKKHIHTTTEQLTLWLKTLKDYANSAVVSQYIIVFCYMDVLAQIYSYFDGTEKGDGEKFRCFIDKFCLVEWNKKFNDNNRLHVLKWHMLRKLRCDLLHFCAISNFYWIGQYKILLGNSDNIPNDWQKKGDKLNWIFVDAQELFQITLEWWQHMIDAIYLQAKDNNLDFLVCLRNLSCELDKRSAVVIKSDKFNA